MYPSGCPSGRRAGSFPRTRGDVPICMPRGACARRLPPHARGCTAPIVSFAGRGAASPARAGMYLLSIMSAVRGSGFPRTRGDVPEARARSELSRTLPPHARGCTFDPDQLRRPLSASPARAGMYPAWDSVATPWARFPRTRGDVPHAVYALLAPFQLPPHARGCTLLFLSLSPTPRASPARAGMYRDAVGDLHRDPSFPRTRGDVPEAGFEGTAGARLPPHARGCTLPDQYRDGEPAASPARAGMYPSRPRHTAPRPGFPRTRGDVPPQYAGPDTGCRLPPHARGCTLVVLSAMTYLPASPARAGMYPATCRSRSAAGGFPRTRGDVPSGLPLRPCRPALPPHARGCTARNRARGGDPRASPARAGMYPALAETLFADAGFPRTRGDVPRGSTGSSARAELPPHARGCTL